MRALLVTAAVVAVLFVLGLVVGPLVAERVAERMLDTAPGYDAEVADVDVSLGGWGAVDGVTLSRPGVDLPFVEIDRMVVRPHLRSLLRGDRIADVRIDGLRVHYVLGEDEASSQTAIDADWIRRQAERFPVTVDRLTVRNGAVHYHDRSVEPDVELVVDRIEVDGEDLAHLSRSDEELFGKLDVRGRIEEDGELLARVSVDPYAEAPRFRLDARVEGVPLAATNDVLRAYGKLDVEQGTFSAVTHLDAEGGSYSGYVVPELTDVEVVGEGETTGEKKPVLAAIWESLVGTAKDVAEVVTPGEDRIAVKVPIEGEFAADPAVIEVLNALPKAWFGALTRAVGAGAAAGREATEASTGAGQAVEGERGDDGKGKARDDRKKKSDKDRKKPRDDS